MRPRFLMGPTAVMLGFVAAVGPAAAQTKAKMHVAAPDANALVRKMVATYQAARTIQETSEAQIAQIGAGSYIQASTIKYKQPLFLKATAQDPYTGSIDTYCDGKTITIYSGKQNIFTRRTAPSTMREVAAIASRAARETLGVAQAPILSPLSFLISGKMPNEAKSFRYVGTKTVEGRKTVLVLGQVDPHWIESLFPNVHVEPIKREVALWIDPKTNLLVKAAAAITWKSTAPGQDKHAKPTHPGGFVFSEVHRGTVLNADIPDSDFRFYAPKDAIEKFQQTR